MKVMKISRWHEEEVKLEYWKELMSGLVLCGYEVWMDDADRICFRIGNDDEIIERSE